MSRPVHIRAAGMVTAVGLDAPSSCAGMRARLDGFRETRFVGPGGEWLIGAAVPLPKGWLGEKRMAHLAAGAIAEIFREVPAAEAGAEVILCMAEEDRPGRPVTDPEALLRQVFEILDLPPRTATRAVRHGRPSGIVALERARQLIAGGESRAVIIVGIDSYLTGQAVAHFIRAGRLLTSANANGFIPGEAAAAVLCTAGEGDLRLDGIGLAREDAYLYNGRDADGLDLPLRGEGMSRAYGLALDEAGVNYGQVGYRITDWTGEKFFFQQSVLAVARHLRDYHGFQDVWNLAESLGNTGAAAVPLMLGHALTAARKGYAGGRSVLIESSGDDGACGVAVLAEANREQR